MPGTRRIASRLPERRAQRRSVRSASTRRTARGLAGRTGRHAYLGVLQGGEVTVTRVVAPSESPPVGVVEGFHGASHALALGKVLLAASGAAGARAYAEEHGLEAFTRRTITHPGLFESHIAAVASQRFAADVQEFSDNLCCVAAPIGDEGGDIRGAIGLSSSARLFKSEARGLISMARWAADEVSAILRGEPGLVARPRPAGTG